MNLEDQKELRALILDKKIIAIVRGIPTAYILDTAKAFYRAGIRLMEIPFDQSEPENYTTVTESVRIIRENLPEMRVGAGTVMTIGQVEALAAAGGEYAISADENPEVIKKTKELRMLSIPGAMTPSEIAEAYRSGADFVKVFPAGDLGPGYIKAVRAPLKHIPMMAVGGVNLDNMDAFWKAGCCGFGIGGNLASKELIMNGRFEELEEIAREYASWRPE